QGQKRTGMLKLRMRGLERMKSRLQDLSRQFPDRVAAALYQEAQIELTEAKRRTPYLTGALRSSGIVHQPTRQGGKILVQITFGGEAVDYAVYVHEDLEAFHPHGQAKF